MARDKNADPLRRSGKHNDSTRQKYGHEHYEQIGIHAPNHPPLLRMERFGSHIKGNPTKKKGK